MKRIALIVIVLVLAIGASIPVIRARRAEAARRLLNRAAAYAASDQIQQADATLKMVDPHTPKYNVLRAAIEQRRAGAAPYVFDRTGRAIAVYRDHAVVATDPEFAPLITGGQLSIGAQFARPDKLVFCIAGGLTWGILVVGLAATFWDATLLRLFPEKRRPLWAEPPPTIRLEP